MSDLGIPHKIVEAREPMDAEFAQLYMRNYTPAHEAYGKNCICDLRSGLASSLQVTGGGSEALRCLWRFYDGLPITPGRLASLDRMLLEHAFVTEELTAWVNSVPPAPGWQVGRPVPLGTETREMALRRPHGMGT